MKLARYKNSSPNSYALGATLTLELLNSHPELIRRVFVRPNVKHGEDLQNIINQLQARHIELVESTKAFNVLDAKDSCLLAAEFEKPAQNLTAAATHVVLVNPSDAGNLGTIMRSAAAFGFQNLAIILPAVDAYSPKTVRASMGAVFHLQIEIFPDIETYLAKYGQNRSLYAFMLNQSAKTLAEAQLPSANYSLIFGNEAAGLPKDFATNTGATPIFIPQSSNVDSLNLSVATSIALYHFSQLTK